MSPQLVARNFSLAALLCVSSPGRPIHGVDFVGIGVGRPRRNSKEKCKTAEREKNGADNSAEKGFIAVILAILAFLGCELHEEGRARLEWCQ